MTNIVQQLANLNISEGLNSQGVIEQINPNNSILVSKDTGDSSLLNILMKQVDVIQQDRSVIVNAVANSEKTPLKDLLIIQKKGIDFNHKVTLCAQVISKINKSIDSLIHIQ